jgi:hypothetical protein
MAIEMGLGGDSPVVRRPGRLYSDLPKKKATKKSRRKPARPESVEPLKAQVDAALQLRYGQQEQQLAQRPQLVNDYFQDYQRQLAQINSAQQAGYAQAQQEFSTRAQQMQQGAATTVAAARGESVGQDGLDNSAKAANVRNEMMNAFANLVGTQGQAQSSYFAGRGAVAGAAQLQERLATDRAKQDLQADKGAYSVDFRRKLEDALHTQRLEDAAFGLKQEAEHNDVEAKRRSRVVSRKNTRDRLTATKEKDATKVNQYGYTNSEWLALGTTGRQKIIKTFKPAGGKGGESAESVRAEKNRVAGIREKSGKGIGRLNTIGTLRAQYKKTKVEIEKDGQKIQRYPTPDEIKARLIDEGYSADEIALSSKPRGEWAAREIELAHRLGIRVPRKYLYRKPSLEGKPSAGRT